jgi:hypothetical protein
MIQLRRRPCLAFKTFEGFRIFDELVREKLEGNPAPQPGVFGFVDNPHTPAAQLPYDAIVGDSLANHRAVPAVFGVMLGR